MKEIIQSLLAIFGGSAIIIGALVFLSKKIVEHFLGKEFQKFIVEIKHEKDIQILELQGKSELIIHNYREKIKNLSEERIKAVKEIHNNLMNSYSTYMKFSSIFRPSDGMKLEESLGKDLDESIARLNSLLNCVKENEIFIPTTLSEKIFNWRKNVSVICSVYGPIIISNTVTKTDENNVFMQIQDKNHEVTDQFEEIRKKLKEIIGVDD